MTYNVALFDPYTGNFKIIESMNDYLAAWQRAGAARQSVHAGAIIVLSTETREDPSIRALPHTRLRSR